MGTDSDAAPDPRSLRTLIDQLALLTDELDGQIQTIARVPSRVMEVRPYEGALSIRDLYVRFLERERGENLIVVSGLVDGSAGGKTLDALVQGFDPDDWSGTGIEDIISRIAGVRREIVDKLVAVGSAAWSRSIVVEGEAVSLFDWAYGMALRDADDLREIGIQFYERRMALGIRD